MMPDRRTLARIAVALALGAAGGWLFRRLDMPLAWMIGAMCFTTVAALAKAPVALPPALRSVMVAVLGVMLGSAFTPDLVERVQSWWLTLSVLFLYSAVVGAVAYAFFLRFGRYDPVTAFFAAAPGGLAEMTVLSGAHGGDERVVALVHTARVMLIVLTVPFWFRMLDDYDAARRAASDVALLEAPAVEMLVLAATGVAGAFLARLLRLPATYLIGPMAASAAVHLLGWSAFRPPVELVAAAQVVVGAAIGCRFLGFDPRLMLRTLALAGGATAIMLAGTVLASVALKNVAGVPLPALVLAFAPGGLAEMSLVALALATDAAFVATHHVLRIVFVVVAAPLVFRALARGRARGRP